MADSETPVRVKSDVEGERAELASARSQLDIIFPGKAVALANGQTVIVRKWGWHEVVHEVPALFGRIVAAVLPFREQLAEGGEGALGAIVGPLFATLSKEIGELVRFTVGLDEQTFSDKAPPEGKGLYATEVLSLAAAAIEVNADFFVEISNLAGVAAGHGLSGSALRQLFSGLGSRTQT